VARAYEWILNEDRKQFKKRQKSAEMTVESYRETLDGFKR